MEVDKKKQQVKALLLDIEGTTTSISFVKDFLFPYVTKNLQEYLETNFEDSQCQEDVEALRSLALKDCETDDDVPLIPKADDERMKIISAVCRNVAYQMASDRKSTALKQLQGHVWRAGYDSGNIKGHLYADVLPAITRWREQGLDIYIYSSGSVAAQKLLFGHSEEGDICKLLSGYFDTTTGGKREPESYSKICQEIGLCPQQVLFVTDVAQEAVAARKAGVGVVLSLRPGNAPLSDEDREQYKVIKSFSDILVNDASDQSKSDVKKCEETQAGRKRSLSEDAVDEPESVIEPRRARLID